MIPIIEVPETIRDGMMNYRNVFCREEGFEHVSRYVHESVFESGILAY